MAAGPAGRVDFGVEGAEMLDLRRVVPLPQLRRHKRAFLKLVSQNSHSELRDSDAAIQLFVQYLQTILLL